MKPINISYNLERKIVNVDGYNMSYIQIGDEASKKSIVIIHGSTLNALAMVPYGEFYAKEGYNVIIVDLPGHYEDIAPCKSQFSELADSVAGLMKVLIKEGKLSKKSDVHGWSLGASVAFDIGIRYGELVDALGIIDGSSNWNNIELPPLTSYENKIATITAMFTALKSATVPQESLDKIISELPMTLASVEACNSDFAIDKVLNVDAGIKEIDAPVYMFFGSIDGLTTIEKQNEIMSNLKHGKLYVAEGYGHMTVMEEPECVYNAFKEMKIQ